MMTTIKQSLKHGMDEIIAEYGHGQPITLLAGLVGWQARWESKDRSLRASEASVLLAKAAAIILRLEEEEAADKVKESVR